MMDRDNILGFVMIISTLILAFLGFGFFKGQEFGEGRMVEWVETCWPNKPSWKDGAGTCWINGQRVRVD